MSPYVCLPVEDCPPADAPWLISTRKELRLNDSITAKWKDKWRANFPGASASHEAKTAWACSVETDHLFDRTRPHDVAAQLRSILFETASPHLEVQLLAQRSALERLGVKSIGFSPIHGEKRSLTKNAGKNTEMHKNAATVGETMTGDERGARRTIVDDVADNTSKEGMQVKKENNTIAAEKGSNVSATTKDSVEDSITKSKSKVRDYALLARKRVPKETKVNDIIPDLARAAGLTGDPYVVCAIPHGGLDATAMMMIFPPDIVGKGVHFPLHAVNATSAQSQHPISAVAFEVLRIESKAPFVRECDELMRKHSKHGIGYLLVEKSPLSASSDDSDSESEEDDTPCTADTHHVLWYSHEEDFTRVTAHLKVGEGETEVIKRRLDKGNTDSGNLFVEMVYAELEYVRNITGECRWARKVASLIALTLAVCHGTHFMFNDNECIEQSIKVVKSIGDYWRYNLLKEGKHDNVALGLGLPDDSVSRVASREALGAFLNRCQIQLEKNKPFGHARLTFPFTLPSKRRKRSSVGDAGTRAAPALRDGNGEKRAHAGDDVVLRRPPGRAPNDSNGAAMTWDASGGVWRSRSNPSETKAPKSIGA